jgi:hypothetical protein
LNGYVSTSQAKNDQFRRFVLRQVRTLQQLDYRQKRGASSHLRISRSIAFNCVWVLCSNWLYWRPKGTYNWIFFKSYRNCINDYININTVQTVGV